MSAVYSDPRKQFLHPVSAQGKGGDKETEAWRETCFDWPKSVYFSEGDKWTSFSVVRHARFGCYFAHASRARTGSAVHVAVEQNICRIFKELDADFGEFSRAGMQREGESSIHSIHLYIIVFATCIGTVLALLFSSWKTVLNPFCFPRSSGPR